MFSVVVPSRNRTNLKACLRAVGYRQPGTWRIVIDDGLDISPRGEADLDGLYEAVWLGKKPFVFARNCNIGIIAAAADDVILLNDDALLQTPGGFRALQTVANDNPEFGVVGAVTNVTGQALQKPQGGNALREVPHIAFVCVYIPRRTIQRVGLLDERYSLDYGVEDLDYCEACRRAGLKVGVFDGCYVDHASLESSFRGHPWASRSFARNRELFDQKWGAVKV
jgi:GT2 family glycosyltransferase